MLPTFLGLGAPKAATTWLAKCLSDHPDVFVVDVKETEFFSWGHTVRDLNDYRMHFSDVNGETAVGEITTSYLYWEGTVDRVHDVLPEARLFVSLRNPMDQVYSHYWHLHRQNFHQEEIPRPDSFKAALDMYPEKLLRPARCAEHLDRWLQVFGRDQLHVLFYDDIQTAPAQVLEALYTIRFWMSIRRFGPHACGRTISLYDAALPPGIRYSSGCIRGCTMG